MENKGGVEYAPYLEHHCSSPSHPNPAQKTAAIGQTGPAPQWPPGVPEERGTISPGPRITQNDSIIAQAGLKEGVSWHIPSPAMSNSGDGGPRGMP